jgi:CAAX prenyl protease-like protein
MHFIRNLLRRSPEHARFFPLFIFVLIGFGPAFFGPDSKYFFYAAKTVIGAWLVWEMRALVPEMRWAFSWEAVVAGIVICVLWIKLDPFYPPNHIIMKPVPGDEWEPFARFGKGSGLAWTLIVIRTLGMTFVVPPLEEVFYRSFLYRKFIKNDFMQVPIGYFAGASFLAVSVAFGLMHYEWLPGILCGMAYLGLVIRKKRLGDAMTAHAITNFLLAVWVVWRGDWKFF